MTGGRVSTKGQWADLVREARANGLPAEQWCKEHGVNLQSLETWSSWYDGVEASKGEGRENSNQPRIIDCTVLPSGALVELESHGKPVQEDSSVVSNRKTDGGSCGERTGMRKKKRKPATEDAPGKAEEPGPFVEMPQFADWRAAQRGSDAGHSQTAFDSKLMIRVGGYELYIGDGFREQTLAAVLEVIAHAQR